MPFSFSSPSTFQRKYSDLTRVASEGNTVNPTFDMIDNSGGSVPIEVLYFIFNAKASTKVAVYLDTPSLYLMEGTVLTDTPIYVVDTVMPLVIPVGSKLIVEALLTVPQTVDFYYIKVT